MSRSSHRALLGETIRTYRKQVRLSQESLAEKADLSPKFLGEVERGVANISMDAVSRIAKALAVSVNQLTKGF